MIRSIHAVIALGALLAAAPALAGDLIVDAAPAADAASRAYATVSLGVSSASTIATISEFGGSESFGIGFDLDTGYVVSGAIGTTVLPSLRGEVEFSVVKSSISEFLDIPSDGDIQVTGYNILGNLWYDVDTGSALTPYVGGGIGWGYDVVTGGSEPGYEMYTSGFLYQLGAGVRFAATETIGLDLGYRYRVQPEAELSDNREPFEAEFRSNATNHIVQAGVTVGF